MDRQFPTARLSSSQTTRDHVPLALRFSTEEYAFLRVIRIRNISDADGLAGWNEREDKLVRGDFTGAATRVVGTECRRIPFQSSQIEKKTDIGVLQDDSLAAGRVFSI